MDLIEEYKSAPSAFSTDYYKVLSYFSLSKKPSDNFTFRKVLHYEGIGVDVVHNYITSAMEKGLNFCDLTNDSLKEILKKTENVGTILNSSDDVSTKVSALEKLLTIDDATKLKSELEEHSTCDDSVASLEHEEEEQAEMDELEIKPMSAIELMSIVGSKGLSADHVMIIGFDDRNMDRVTRNAFYVALTRARKSLALLSSLQASGSTRPHSYLDQLPEDHLDFCKYTKSDQKVVGLASKQALLQYFESIVNARSRFRRPAAAR